MKSSILNGYEVSLATSRKSDQIIGLLKDVAKWLQEQKVDQWGFLAGGGEDEEIRQAIQRKETFIVRRDREVVGTFTLCQEQSWWDQHTWGKLNDEAIYLHRLALKRSEIGSGLGKVVLKWLETDLKNQGKRILRLDCVGENLKLNDFYLSNGFHKVGENDGHSLYQKDL
ncbi:hypothetical protein AV656_11420 [Bhargavaea cecembensis]|uniref:N-acetyltransferase domain-containing protein n=1 Tax=Bhargavaea cecembensis TaxID=394098 RepID=A0A161RCC7_9BACL|nr:GNAT family N-acetyltransferase [Bhargavaea cecembensis]KZE37182.1 hypothetical protein AV656_11420 [Bhargavaea cecembensis]